MAIRLRAAGYDAITIFEKGDGVGGTWRDNTYPGSGCDIPSLLYCFSFARKTNWTRAFAEQPEILAYFESLVGRFDLARHLRFRTGSAWRRGTPRAICGSSRPSRAIDTRPRSSSRRSAS